MLVTGDAGGSDMYWRGRMNVKDRRSWVLLFDLSGFAATTKEEQFCRSVPLSVGSGFLSFLCHQTIRNLFCYPNPVTGFKFFCFMTFVKVARFGSTDTSFLFFYQLAVF